MAALLVCAYCTMPLLVAHVVKPGFAELLVVVMLLAGLCVLERRDGPLRPGDWALVAAFAAGCTFGKKEAIVWAAWLLCAAATRELAVRGLFRWRQLVAAWTGITAAVVSLHLLLGERLAPAAGTADDRIRWVYQHRWAPRAFARFAAEALSASSFGLVWWWTAVAALGLAMRSPADRGWAALSAFPIAGVIYFCCVTGNVEHTLLGDDAGRFLLQVSPIAFCLLVRWARSLERAAPALAGAADSG
jgi:hypothetical protein